MKKTLLTLILAGFSLVNCTSTGFGPGGSIFSSTKIGVYGTEIGGSKTGEACTKSILGLVAFGDGSVAAASKKGNVKNIKTIDFKGFSILSLYASLCTVVKGD